MTVADALLSGGAGGSGDAAKTTAEAHPFPAAVSAGLAPVSAPPQAPAGALHEQVSATLSSSGGADSLAEPTGAGAATAADAKAAPASAAANTAQDGSYDDRCCATAAEGLWACDRAVLPAHLWWGMMGASSCVGRAEDALAALQS